MDLIVKNEFLLQNSILKIKKEVEIFPFDEGVEKDSYLIISNNRHWKVSELIYYVFCGIDGKRNISEIKEYLYNNYQIQIEEEKLEKIINMAFIQHGLIEGTTATSTRPENRMLWARFTLIKPTIIEKFKIFDFIFKKFFVITLTIIVLIWMLFVFYLNSNSQVINNMLSLDIKDIILCYIFIFIAGLFHELGHSLAAMSYGVAPGRIGIGVYFIMPILFSDVTKIWRLKRQQRVVVDLGGMYLQGVFLLISFLINIFFIKSTLLNVAILMSAFQILGNFNPFIRFDGYWVLVDLLGINDIKAVMYQLWIDLFRKLTNKSQKIANLSRVKKFIIYAYSIFTICFFIYFLRFLINSFELGLQNIFSDISILMKLPLSELDITPGGVIEYISMRFATYVVLLFFIRIIWLNAIKKLYILLRSRTVKRV